MRKIKASYEILTPIDPIKDLQLIEKVGRVCYKSEDRITEDGESAKSFVTARLNPENPHEAVIEHSFLSVKFTVDRGISHELVRHRLASFAKESTRYCNYSNDRFDNEIAVIDLAPGIELDAKMKNVSAENIALILAEWVQAVKDAETHYIYEND